MSLMYKICIAAAVMAATFVALFLSHRFFKRLLRNNPKIHLRFLRSFVGTLIMVLGIYIALSPFEVAGGVGKTLLQSGSLIIAVATFAAQQALGNVISGFSLSASRPCDVGQKIKVVSGGSILAEGIVKDMTMRHVVIDQYDGQSCIVPNSVIDSSVIINTNYVEQVGNYMEFEVAYGTDVEKARDVLKDILENEPLVLNPDKINIFVNRLTASGFVLKFTCWTKDLNDSFRACSNIRQAVLERFPEEGIDIPYNVVDVRITEDVGSAAAQGKSAEEPAVCEKEEP